MKFVEISTVSDYGESSGVRIINLDHVVDIYRDVKDIYIVRLSTKYDNIIRVNKESFNELLEIIFSKIIMPTSS